MKVKITIDDFETDQIIKDQITEKVVQRFEEIVKEDAKKVDKFLDGNTRSPIDHMNPVSHAVMQNLTFLLKAEFRESWIGDKERLLQHVADRLSDETVKDMLLQALIHVKSN